MSEEFFEATSYFLTDYIAEINGHALLVGGCQKSKTWAGQEVVREWIVIFPDANPKIASRISSHTDDEEFPFFNDQEADSNKLLKIAKAQLRAWGRKTLPSLCEEIKDAISNGTTVSEEELQNIHYSGLIGASFYSLSAESKVTKIKKVSRRLSQLHRPNHIAENFSDETIGETTKSSTDH